MEILKNDQARLVRLVRVVGHFSLRSRMDTADTLLKAAKNLKNPTRGRGSESAEGETFFSACSASLRLSIFFNRFSVGPILRGRLLD